jgi:two-component system, NarL family, invasion response regulator UvrY
VTSVLVIDDHPIVVQGCRHLLQEAGIATILEAGGAVTGYELFCREHPDVVIVDLALRGNELAGLSLIQRIKSHNHRTHVLVLSMHSDPILVRRALEAGAAGYILKDTAAEELLKALKAIQDGRTYLSHDLALQVAIGRMSSRDAQLAELTPRELEMLALLAKGRSYSDIAETLNVSYKTVVNTSSQLKQKLNVGNLAALVRASVRLLAADESGAPRT